MCKHLNHFAGQYDSATNDGKGRRANEVEVELETDTHRVFLEEEFLKDVYLYYLKAGKSQNPKYFPLKPIAFLSTYTPGQTS